jgi:hypothetical protein
VRACFSDGVLLETVAESGRLFINFIEIAKKVWEFIVGVTQQDFRAIGDAGSIDRRSSALLNSNS